MSFEKVYQRSRKEENNSKEIQWVPQTPAKASVIRPQKTWSDGLASRSESDNKDLHDFNELLNSPFKSSPPILVSSTLADHDTIEELQCDTKTPDDNSSPCVDFGILTPGQKRKKDSMDMNGRPRKKPKKKVYWPKVVGQSKRRRAPVPKPKRDSKEIGEGKPKGAPKLKTQKPSNNDEKTPRPSTPEQKRSYVRRTTSCKRSLNFDSENSSQGTIAIATATVSSLHQLEQLNQNPSKSVINELGCKYNSLQVYQMRSLESLCLTQNNKLEPIFSNVCKKKRSRRWKPFSSRLDSRLSVCIRSIWSIKKKKRSKGCTIRRSNLLLLTEIPMCNQSPIRSTCGYEVRDKVVEIQGSSCGNEVREKVEEIQDNTSSVFNLNRNPSKDYNHENFSKASAKKLKGGIRKISKVVMESLLKKFMSLKIDDKVNRERKKKKKHIEIVPYKEPANQVVPYKIKKRRQVIKVNLDEESLRVWKLLRDGKVDEEMDSEKQKYWEEQINVYKGRVQTFINRMHLVQGNRRFSAWKGSVLDSVIGVFLTQNVSDHLSSSAYMSLAARFPVQTTTSNYESNEDRETPCSQESVGSNHVSNEKRETSCSQETHSENFDDSKIDEMTSQKVKDSSKVRIEDISDIHDPLRVNKINNSRKPDSPGIIFGKTKSAISRKTMNEEEKEKEEKEKQYWEGLRKMYTRCGMRDSNYMDSVNWEAVRQAGKEAIAEVIACRGQHNIIADRILAFLNKLMEMHGSTDIEWLRYAPPQKVKEYLLKVYGLGLKSVECIRLLALQHIAFPVDVNVARITVRLGWVPLEPLPGKLHLHLLEQYPVMDVVQQFLLPRLCTLDQRTLYQLHYQLITFGKVFCTKTKPNCNACPMKGDCRHFASALASANLALPAGTTADERATDKSIVEATNFVQDFTLLNNPRSISISEVNKSSTTQYRGKECEPIIEMPASPEPENRELIDENHEIDIEDFSIDVGFEQIPTIKLNSKECMEKSYDSLDEDGMNKSRALVSLTAYAASIPAPKLKDVNRLRTERLVYELPDSSSLLEGFEKRELDDPCNYLLAMWTPDEIKNQCEVASNSCNHSDFSHNNAQEENSDYTVPGTILIPCRTAMKGRFPLNGTYFQVNEVFADDYSSRHPINVPRKMLWELERRIVYFGTSTSTILRGLMVKAIHDCFWEGFICVRGFDRKTAAPRPLSNRFHISTTNKQGKKKNDST